MLTPNDVLFYTETARAYVDMVREARRAKAADADERRMLERANVATADAWLSDGLEPRDRLATWSSKVPDEFRTLGNVSVADILTIFVHNA